MILALREAVSDGLRTMPSVGTVTASRYDSGGVPANPYRGYRFPEEIISQCVWLYFNLSVSLREVELMMAYGESI